MQILELSFDTILLQSENIKWTALYYIKVFRNLLKY